MAASVRRANIVAAVIAIFALAAGMAWLASPLQSIGQLGFVGGVFLFNASPVLVACSWTLIARDGLIPPLTLMFIIGWSFYEAHAVYWNFSEPDSQSGLAFLALPGIGLMTLFVAALIGAVAIQLRRRSNVR